MKEEITKALFKLTERKDINVDIPENQEYGDYSSNVAMQMFSNPKIVLYKFEEEGGKEKREKFKNPRDFAEELVKALRHDKSLSKVVDKIEVAGPGFINFFVKSEALLDLLLNSTPYYEIVRHSLKNKKKIMVEFAHPNTHKAFHIGHLRNISTGESIARILELLGYKVIRANYQGDVGMHIAKALWGINKLGFIDPKDIKKRVEFLGKAYATGATAYEDDVKTKKEIQEINKKIYSKVDEEINKLYSETRKWSLDYFGSIYERLYTKFDRLFFESECYVSGKNYALEGLERGILKKSDGAIIFPGSIYSLHDRVFITSEGTPTYEAKDLGLVKLQLKEFNPDSITHIVGPEQSEYFKVVFKAQELLFPETKGKQLHIPYGWVRLKEGKMSSRTGKVVLGESLLDDAKNEILKSYKTDDKTAEEIAVGAVKYSFLKVGREQDIAYDLKESVSLEGNSGPYLQYTVARINSVLAKSKIKNPHLKTSLNIKNLKLETEEVSVLSVLTHFQEVIEAAAEKYSPNLLCNYLYSLAQKYNSFYNKLRIVGIEDKNVETFRLILTERTGKTLKKGLELLGIKTPEKM